MTVTKLRARLVLPITATPIRDGVITVADGVIRNVQSFCKREHSGKFSRPSISNDSRCRYLDLGEVAVLPGLINAHTHLEFADLKQPLGEAGMEFPEWIKLVVANRFARDSEGAGNVAIGINESIELGTVAVGEIATNNWLQREFAGREAGTLSNMLSGTIFLERLGNDTATHEQLLVGAEHFNLETRSSEIVGWEGGLSPHAPYTVDLPFLQKLVQTAERYEMPVAMHLAESKAEIELLRSGSGPFKQMLQDLNAWYPQRFQSETSILDYLQVLSSSKRCLVIHGNYLTDNEMDFIAHNRQYSIVFCPRTHRFFRHDVYPISKILRLGINLAIGTDSRASNPDLSVWNEMKCVAESFPNLDRKTILEMGTVNGARALGLESTLGSIEKNKLARLISIPFESCDGDDFYAAILNQRIHPRVVALDKLAGETGDELPA